MISLALFFLLISAGSFYTTARFNRRYEEAVPLTIFCAVEIVFLFGLLDNLKLGFYAVCLAAVVLYVLGAIQIRRDRRLGEFCRAFFTPTFFIFLVLLVLFALRIAGRVAVRGDEFSYWAISVKKMWYLNKLPCVLEAEPDFTEYPPGMQLFEYIALCFCGKFSEWRMSFAYLTYLLALFLPFLRCTGHKRPLVNILLAVVVLTAASILYPQVYDSLMVDCVLGATFAFGMASVFLLQKRERHWDLLQIFSVVMSANMLILIKSAGKLFAAIVILSLVLAVCISEKKNLLRTGWQFPLFGVILSVFPFITAWFWKLKYTMTPVGVAFDSGAYDLGEFIRILLGANEGYRSEIRGRFISFLTTETIDIGFLSLNNLQVYLLFAALILLVTAKLQKEQKGRVSTICVLLGGVPVYWLGLMASYMYTFSEAEGTALASMQRYLNIYQSALVLFSLFLMLSLSLFQREHELRAYACLLCVLVMIPYNSLIIFLSRTNVEEGIALREPYKILAEQIQADTERPADGEKPCALLICRGGYPHIPVNHFTYLLWPDYRVPWECSYGSTPLFEGDRYTQILTADEFHQHILDLGVDYIAIYTVDDDFIQQYSQLFDSPLSNGQVYRVTPDTLQYTLLHSES